MHSRAHKGTSIGHSRRRNLGLGAPIVGWIVVGWIALAAAGGAAAQGGGDAPMMDANMADAAPTTNVGGGDFFSQELGSLVRLRFSTESYGQDQTGNFDIGTMQVTNFDDATAFFDGQVSLNEDTGIGFNLGVGYRWMAETPLAFEPERLTGVSLWADGTDAHDGNFFPQVGVSYESLGDMWDLRVNGYVPVGARRQVGHFNPTGVVGFSGNEIVDQTVADRHTSFDAAELEIARRLGNERDAWAFAGPYVLANDDDSSAGWKVGVRGYAYPDLMLQFDVSQDDIFNTTAAFSLVWFVGRTRSNFQPACGLPDRMREPVLRNDYVVLAKDKVHSGNPLTETVSGQPFNVVHVASDAPPGGNGTFEHPLNNVADVFDHSQEGKLVNLVNGVNTPTPGSIILLHAKSVFDGPTGATGTLVLKDNQRLLGEGNGMTFTVNSTQHGPLTPIPETFPGARADVTPIIKNSQGTPVVSLADTDEVANFTIDGSSGPGPTLGIGPGANGAGNPNIHDMLFQNVAGTGLDKGIMLTSFLRDNNGTDATAGQTIEFNVNLSKLTFNNLNSDEITIDATPPNGIVLPDSNITNNETMTIDSITSTNGHGRGLLLEKTNSGGTATISNFNHNGGTTGQTALEFFSDAGTANINTSKLSGGSPTLGDGVEIDGGSTGSFTFATTVQFDTLNPVRGRSVFITGNTAGTATFAGDITAMPDVGNNAIELTGNTGQTIQFLGNLKLTTPAGGGKAFTATGGGTLLVTGTDNELTTIDGTALEITGMTIDATAGATFKNVNAGDATGGPVSGIVLTDSTGGPITVGDVTALPGDTGTIQNTTGDAIVISNTANATINGVKIDNTLGGPTAVGVHVTKSTPTTTSTVDLGNMEIDGGLTGLQVTGGGTTAGTLTMTVNDTNINGPTGKGIQIGDPTLAANGVDNGSIAFTNTKVDGMNVTATSGVEVGNSNAAITFDSASSILGMAGGSAFVVSGGTNANVTYNGTITSTVARDVDVTGLAGGTVSFSPSSKITDTGGKGINIHGNTAGSVLFQGTNSLHTASNDAVTLDTNTGESTTFSALDIITTGTGKGFNALGGGTVEVDGATNTIVSDQGTGLSIVGMIIGGGGATFKSVNVGTVSTGPTTNGIVLTNDTGGPITIGAPGNAAGDGGTIQHTGSDGIKITDTANVTLNGVKVTNTGTAPTDNAILVKHDNAAGMSVTLNNTQINTAQNGLHINGTGGTGAFNVSSLAGSTTGAVGNSLEVEGAVSSVNDSDAITNTAATGHSINIHNVSAGTVTASGTVDDSGLGVAIQNNTGGSINLLGTYTLHTGTHDAVTITGNATAANIQLTNLNIDTTSGQGFVANGGGTLAVSGTTNDVDTTTGVGVNISNTTIAGSGVNFDHVNVTAGTTNGIILTNLTGGQVTIGNATGATNSGGALTTVGDAVVILNTQNVDLNHLHIVSASGVTSEGLNIDQNASATTAMDVTINDLNIDTNAAGENGIDVLANSTNAFTVRLENSTLFDNVHMSDTGSGTFGLLVSGTNVTTTGTTTAFDMELSGSAHLANLVFNDGNTFDAGDANALLINSAGATSKTVNLFVDGTGTPNTFSNVSATNFAANFLSQGGTTLNATVQGNVFDNATPAKDFNMATGTSTARVLLNLGGTSGNELNIAAPGTGSFILDNTAGGTFTIFDKTDTLAGTRNTGTVTPLPNAAAFGDTATPPTPPTPP
jgi:hypothetical protein